MECQERQRCECAVLDKDIKLPTAVGSDDTNSLKLQFARLLLGSPHCDPMRLWARIIENYTERAMTFEKNRVVALSGVASRMQSFRLGDYMAGLFFQDMPGCFLWSVQRPGARHETFMAPTWSWASVSMPSNQPPRVQFTWQRHRDGSSYVGEAIFRTDEQRASGRCGIGVCAPIISGALEIKTFDHPVVGMQEMGYIIYDDTPRQHYAYSLHHDEKKASFRPDIILHAGRNKLESGHRLFLMALARREKSDYALVLKQLESDEEFATHLGVSAKKVPAVLRGGVFIRIGIISGLEEDCQHLV